MNETFPLLAVAVVLSATLVACGRGAIWWVRSSHQVSKSDTWKGERAWTGTTFDSKVVSERVRHLRENHVAALAGRPDDELKRKERVALARRDIGSRSYFQHPQEEGAEHAAEIHAP